MRLRIAVAMTMGFVTWLVGTILVGRASCGREYFGWLMVTLGAFVWGMAREAWKHAGEKRS